MQLIGILILVFFMALANLLGFLPELPQPEPHRTIRQMCTSPVRPEWCNEYEHDLAEGRAQRIKTLEGETL